MTTITVSPEIAKRLGKTLQETVTTRNPGWRVLLQGDESGNMLYLRVDDYGAIYVNVPLGMVFLDSVNDCQCSEETPKE